MGLLPPDFESGAYTNFATPARIKNDKTILIMRQPTGIRNIHTANNNCQISVARGKLSQLFCS